MSTRCGHCPHKTGEFSKQRIQTAKVKLKLPEAVPGGWVGNKHSILYLSNKPSYPLQALLIIYPTGQKYTLELMFAKFATVKIAKDLNPLKISPN